MQPSDVEETGRELPRPGDSGQDTALCTSVSPSVRRRRDHVLPPVVAPLGKPRGKATRSGRPECCLLTSPRGPRGPVGWGPSEPTLFPLTLCQGADAHALHCGLSNTPAPSHTHPFLPGGQGADAHFPSSTCWHHVSTPAIRIHWLLSPWPLKAPLGTPPRQGPPWFSQSGAPWLCPRSPHGESGPQPPREWPQLLPGSEISHSPLTQLPGTSGLCPSKNPEVRRPPAPSSASSEYPCLP